MELNKVKIIIINILKTDGYGRDKRSENRKTKKGNNDN